MHDAVRPPKGAETMKCTVCRGPAIIRMPRHNAHFCETHFLAHVRKQVARAVKDFRMFPPGARLLLAVSGGKDSMAAWDLLLEAGYRIEAVHIDPGFGEFSEASRQAVLDYGASRKAPFRICTFEELAGASFERTIQAARTPACSLCGLTKRYFLNRLALEGEYAAFATGHNLDDETAFLLGNLLHGQTGYLERQNPVLPAAPGLARKVKPLVRVTDRDMRLYVQLRSVPFHPGECPHSQGAVSHVHKELMQQVDDHFPGTKGSFYFQFMEKIQPALKAEKERKAAAGGGTENRRCPSCGYPTRREGLCQFCSIREKLAGYSTDLIR